MYSSKVAKRIYYRTATTGKYDNINDLLIGNRQEIISEKLKHGEMKNGLKRKMELDVPNLISYLFWS